MAIRLRQAVAERRPAVTLRTLKLVLQRGTQAEPGLCPRGTGHRNACRTFHGQSIWQEFVESVRKRGRPDRKRLSRACLVPSVLPPHLAFPGPVAGGYSRELKMPLQLVTGVYLLLVIQLVVVKLPLKDTLIGKRFTQ